MVKTSQDTFWEPKVSLSSAGEIIVSRYAVLPEQRMKFESRTAEQEAFAANWGIRFFLSETRRVLCITLVLGIVLAGAVVAAVLLWKFSECASDTPRLRRTGRGAAPSCLGVWSLRPCSLGCPRPRPFLKLLSEKTNSPLCLPSVMGMHG